MLGLEEAVGYERGLNLVKSRTRCPWTNTLCVGVVIGSLASFLALALAEPQRSLVPCANGNVLSMVYQAVGVLDNVLDCALGDALDDVLKGALDDVLDGVLALLPSALSWITSGRDLHSQDDDQYLFSCSKDKDVSLQQW